MEVIPAIDLRHGRCVRLEQGDFSRETAFSDDPVAMARHWQAQGAPRLHVVDLDGAAAGAPQQTGLIAAIVAAVSIPVQVGGGLRTLDHVHALWSLGAERVVLGTVALQDPGLVRTLCAEAPHRIVVALDARDGYVAVRGWQETSRVHARDLLAHMSALGVRRFLYTDIARDGTLAGPDFETLAALAADMARRSDHTAAPSSAHGIPLLASGGIASLGHIRRLAALGLEGCIVGRALYTGAFSLQDAIAIAEAEEVPE